MQGLGQSAALFVLGQRGTLQFFLLFTPVDEMVMVVPLREILVVVAVGGGVLAGAGGIGRGAGVTGADERGGGLSGMDDDNDCPTVRSFTRKTSEVSGINNLPSTTAIPGENKVVTPLIMSFDRFRPTTGTIAEPSASSRKQLHDSTDFPVPK